MGSSARRVKFFSAQSSASKNLRRRWTEYNFRKIRHSPEDPHRTFRRAPATGRRCTSTCPRRRSLNLLVQTSARQGEHKKTTGHRGVSFTVPRDYITAVTVRRLPLESPDCVSGASLFRETNPERLHFREIPDAAGRDDDFVVRVSAIRHVLSAAARRSPRETRRRYSCWRERSRRSEVAALRSRERFGWYRKLTALHRSRVFFTSPYVPRDSSRLRSAELFLSSRNENRGASGVVYLATRHVAATAYPPHLLIVPMATSASLARSIPAEFRYARGAAAYAKSTHVSPIITIHMYNEGRLAHSGHSRSVVSLPLGTCRKLSRAGDETRENAAPVDASSKLRSSGGHCLAEEKKKKPTGVTKTHSEHDATTHRLRARAMRSNRISATKCGNRLPRPPRRDWEATAACACSARLLLRTEPVTKSSLLSRTRDVHRRAPCPSRFRPVSLARRSTAPFPVLPLAVPARFIENPYLRFFLTSITYIRGSQTSHRSHVVFCLLMKSTRI